MKSSHTDAPRVHCPSKHQETWIAPRAPGGCGLLGRVFRVALLPFPHRFPQPCFWPSDVAAHEQARHPCSESVASILRPCLLAERVTPHHLLILSVQQEKSSQKCFVATRASPLLLWEKPLISLAQTGPAPSAACVKHSGHCVGQEELKRKHLPNVAITLRLFAKRFACGECLGGGVSPCDLPLYGLRPARAASAEIREVKTRHRLHLRYPHVLADDPHSAKQTHLGPPQVELAKKKKSPILGVSMGGSFCSGLRESDAHESLRSVSFGNYWLGIGISFCVQNRGLMNQSRSSPIHKVTAWEQRMPLWKP
ncbi:hypothetical protein E2320_014116 [Naja naja]|nr:hypothetical protein E2320_014116 [Naja naja]